MDNYFDGVGQSIEIRSLDRHISRTIRLEHRVRFTFRFEVVFRKFLLEDSMPLPVFLGQDRLIEPLPATVAFSVRGTDFDKPDPVMRGKLERVLGSHWLISGGNCNWLLDRALEEALEILRSQESYVCANLVFGLVLEEDRYYRRLGYGDGDGVGMVPAADSSIASLKEYEAGSCGGAAAADDDDERRCSICLEELSGRDGEVSGRERLLSMPCDHVFHGDCIRNWLKISHYCPLCRYEMPTN